MLSSRICFKTVTQRFLSTSQSVIVNRRENVMTIELNRPKALNSLSLEMCDIVTNELTERINIENSPLSVFLMKGTGGKAFCAGGDVKSLWTELVSGTVERGTGQPGFLHTDFFRREYTMNYLLGTSNVPQLSIWDGIVMGGGVGISVLGEFRVATEKTLFAMPETAIGLFPDVGSSSWLPHLADGHGVAIGMTGCRLGAADLLYSGIATHYITSDKLDSLEDCLVNGNLSTDNQKARVDVRNILDDLQSSCSKPDESRSVLIKNSNTIRDCFGQSKRTVEEIVDALRAHGAKGDLWAEKTLENMLKMSPTSLKLTLAQLQRGKSLDLSECLKMEFRMIMGCMRHGDFQEGIRAVLVDKDNAPRWTPDNLADVTPRMIDDYFKSLGSFELILPPTIN